jgi:hypothetical protein
LRFRGEHGAVRSPLVGDKIGISRAGLCDHLYASEALANSRSDSFLV